MRFGQREQDGFQPESRDSRELHQADVATSLRGVDIRELADAARRRVSRCECRVDWCQCGAKGLPGWRMMLRRLQRISLARVIVAAQDAPVPLMGVTPRLASYLRIEERVPKRGTRRAPVPAKTRITQSSLVLPLEWPFPAATLLVASYLRIEERELDAGGPN
jgi:hypothetical protein